MATALAAAALADPENAALKAAAREQAADVLPGADRHDGRHAVRLRALGDADTDPYADRRANARAVEPKLTYVLHPATAAPRPLTVPKGAEVLLETRLPYLDAAQRREVLRTTALPAGYVLLDGFEQWGRLNLFAAADGYGVFDSDVTVTLDAALGGFDAADTWRNDIDGSGRADQAGQRLAHADRRQPVQGRDRRGGRRPRRRARRRRFGRGDLRVQGGTLATGDHSVRIRGDYAQAGVLDVTLDRGTDPALAVDRRAVLERDSRLVVRFDAEQAPRSGDTVAVIEARSLQGRFAEVSVAVEGWTAEQVVTAHGVSVRLRKM